ncbi:hypothetical protein GCM10027456_41820 [Kineosporia babensis]
MRDERFRLLMGRITPGGLMLAGAGIAWQRPDAVGWLITGALGLAGAGLEAWRTWLAYRYAIAELRHADRVQERAGALEHRRLDLGDRDAARRHEVEMLAHALHDAHRAARLAKVGEERVAELARIEEVEDLWSTPVPERSASLTIDLREIPASDGAAGPSGIGSSVPMPLPRRPRGADRYRGPDSGVP